MSFLNKNLSGFWLSNFHLNYLKIGKELKDKIYGLQIFLEHGAGFLEHFHLFFEIKPKIISLFNIVQIMHLF